MNVWLRKMRGLALALALLPMGCTSGPDAPADATFATPANSVVNILPARNASTLR